ncbi:MAG TPA: class I tRNA ligase family protein, partial [Sphingomicrobium sp.]|nr:class I tRNA ligase family protein [Sphingomicrobium sp.]
GSALVGAMAKHPMHHLGGFFAKPRPFLPGDFVTTDAGTGLVHMSPDHGEDDFALCREQGIDPVFAVEADGKYRADWLWLGGQGSVINPKFNAPDGPICSDLREAGALLSAGDFKHSYPHSWRSKARVIYRCTPQWFIGMDRELDVIPAKAGISGQEDAPRDPAETPASAGVTQDDEVVAPPSLRELAVQAIADTRFVPEKGRNRIAAMVQDRPDWVISRQRAWGVPIALFVEKTSGELLVDPEVNRRIVAAVREQGVDAWSPENAAHFLGERNPGDYEMQTDILDVWFDSGCTHVFTLESGRWPDQSWPADLYLEGSDQHRGWFQSSLLESCGTRGRAPFKAVLTHGFTMDARGMKMSKSLGNTINPLDLMKESGADILRLWALSVDTSEDHRIGKEILAGVSDQYRKLRNTFRYLLGALDGFSDEEKLPIEQMPELERYMLALLAELDGRLRQATEDFDFTAYTRLIADFANNDLSAFYFDIRKDCLYCDAPTDPKRRAYRTVLDILFHALVRWCAPVLVFTAEEVWGTRYPDGGSVHLLEWAEIGKWSDPALLQRWHRLRLLRSGLLSALEQLRRDKIIGSSLEAQVDLKVLRPESFALLSTVDFAEIAIVSEIQMEQYEPSVAADPSRTKLEHAHGTGFTIYDIEQQGSGDLQAFVVRTDNHKCGRCWRHLPEVAEDGALCARCDEVVGG